MTTNNAVDTGLAGQTGTGKFVGDTAPTITSPLINAMYDQINNLPVISFVGVASAVNYIQTLNSAAGNILSFTATGTDSNISFNVNAKGTGRVAITGISTNTAAAAGYVGEFLSASNLASSPITFTTNTPKSLQNITLTAGDWDVWGNIFWSGTTVTSGFVGLSTTNNTLPDNSLITQVFPVATGNQTALVAPQQRFLVSGSTTVYIVGNVTGTGTLSGSGGIYARRRS